MGGEETCGVNLLVKNGGLPPRGRGRVYHAPATGAGIGITPAWAGKRRQRDETSALMQDYPRVGGEEGVHLPASGERWKLPPRGRGRGKHLVVAIVRVRITPAWAGKSSYLQ